jgi:peptide/nickel transport system ATP-binding protein
VPALMAADGNAAHTVACHMNDAQSGHTQTLMEVAA